MTGGSGSIGAGLVAGYRRRGWAVVASARVIEPSGDASLLTVAADITERAAADRVIDAALGRFGRIDTLVNAVSLGITQTPADPPESYDDLGGWPPPPGWPGQASDVSEERIIEYGDQYPGPGRGGQWRCTPRRQIEGLWAEHALVLRA